MDDNGLRSATTARGLCRGRVLRAFVVVQPFDGHSSIGSASITGSTTSRALPSASHPCGLFGGSLCTSSATASRSVPASDQRRLQYF